jgi:hypothetical protein
LYFVLFIARTIGTAWIQSYCYRFRFDTVVATTQALNTSVTKVPIRRYKPSCNNCFHFGISVKSVGAIILTTCWEQITTARRQIKTVRRISEGSGVMKITRHVNLLSCGRPLMPTVVTKSRSFNKVLRSSGGLTLIVKGICRTGPRT